MIQKDSKHCNTLQHTTLQHNEAWVQNTEHTEMHFLRTTKASHGSLMKSGCPTHILFFCKRRSLFGLLWWWPREAMESLNEWVFEHLTIVLLQCIAACCSVFRCVAVCCNEFWVFKYLKIVHNQTLALVLPVHICHVDASTTQEPWKKSRLQHLSQHCTVSLSMMSCFRNSGRGRDCNDFCGSRPGRCYHHFSRWQSTASGANKRAGRRLINNERLNK